MKKLFLIIIVWSAIHAKSICQSKINVIGLIFRNNTAFTLNSEIPYTGKVFSLDDYGRIHWEGFYKKGKKEGIFKTYYRNPYSIYIISNYKEGILHGKEILFERGNGKIKVVRNYSNGQLHGSHIAYYNYPSIKEFEENYLNGIPIGIHRKWHYNGNLATEYDHYYTKGQNYSNIKIESIKEYYLNGVLKTKYEIIDSNTFKRIDYYPNGNQLHSHLYYIPNPKNNSFKKHFFGHISRPYFNGPKKFEVSEIKQLEEEFLESKITCCEHPVEKSIGESICFDSSGNIFKKTKYFYPIVGKAKKIYFDGSSLLFEIDYYMEVYDKWGKIERKIAGNKRGDSFSPYAITPDDNFILIK